jgi:8-oxo-dGTP pyrophosphatase MutT (NUDIX family)
MVPPLATTTVTGPDGWRLPGSVGRVPTPEFIVSLRARIGHEMLWLSTAAGVVFDAHGQVLLGRRSDTGNWALPGGIIDPGEEPADAAVREIFEETGVVAVPERLVSVGVSPPTTYRNGDQVQYLDHTFLCRATGGEARVNDSESVEVSWFSIDELPPMGERTLGLLQRATSDAAEAAFIFSGVARILERGR